MNLVKEIKELKELINKENVLWYREGNEVVVSFSDQKKAGEFCHLLHKIGEDKNGKKSCK